MKVNKKVSAGVVAVASSMAVAEDINCQISSATQMTIPLEMAQDNSLFLQERELMKEQLRMLQNKQP